MLPLPSSAECLRILHSCNREKVVPRTLSMHSHLCKFGLQCHLFLGNCLVSMLIDIRRVYDAEDVFGRLTSPDSWSWNALINGYVKSGRPAEALALYQEMQQSESLLPSEHTFALLLKACITLKDLETGLQIHGEISRRGSIGRNAFVGSMLVDMYAKHGLLYKAQQVFDQLQSGDVVLWTNLLTGYTEHGHVHEAFNCFEQMQAKGITPDVVTYVCILKACGGIGVLERGQTIHSELERKGLLERNIVLGNALVDMYAKFGLICKTQQVFNRLPARNVISWNTLMAAYVDHGQSEDAVNCFEQMKIEGVLPDSVSVICSLKACCDMRDIEKGSAIHTEAKRIGVLETDLFVGSALVDMYAKCNSLIMAQKVLDKLQVRDTVVWTALISGYSENGNGEEALKCLMRMQLDGIPPNAITYVCSLKACGCVGAMDKGEELHSEIERQGLIEKDLVIANALVDMYAKGGVLPKAQQLFDRLKVRDVISWNSLITGYAQLGESRKVFHNFDKMLGEGMQPDPITYLAVLTACLRTGLRQKSETYFEAMSRDHGIVPTLEHHACVLHLLGRVGHLDEARFMMHKMTHTPNLVIWRTMLDACRTLGNISYGIKAFKRAVSLDKEDAALYTFMTEILANHSFAQEYGNEGMAIT